MSLQNNDKHNLIQLSICTCNSDTRIHKTLWNHLKSRARPTHELEAIILDRDNEKNTIFELMALHSSKKVFTYIIQEKEGMKE